MDEHLAFNQAKWDRYPTGALNITPHQGNSQTYSMKILFICKLRNLDNYRIPFGLLNSARFVAEAIRAHGAEAKVVDVIDGNFIDREVHQYKPTHVMLEALWVTPAKIMELLKLHKNVQWVVRIHSKAPFLAMEGIAFEWLNEYRKIAQTHSNFIISANNIDFNKELNEIGYTSTYLPNIYTPPQPYPRKVADGFLDIGCFGAVRPLKNQFLQAIAAIKFANEMDKPLRFHINGNRTEQKGEQTLKNLRALFDGQEKHELVEHEWMAHEDFIKLISTMDLGMQVSLSESFNIVTADFVGQNVPIIVSNDITWMSIVYRVDPSSSEAMVNRLWFTYLTSKFGLHKINRLVLDRYNSSATKEWLKYLDI